MHPLWIGVNRRKGKRRVPRCVHSPVWRCSSYFAQAQAALGIALAPGQVEGLRAALGRGLAVITGGPGTGKTTMLKCLLAICERRQLWVELATPTGRAARRMSYATGGQAKTIYRMLQFAPGQGGFRKNRADPLAGDLCVVDEREPVHG